MSLKPITLYSHQTGPNPWKVAIILEELNIPYKTEWVDFADIKKPAFEAINVNGRVPAIVDPNNGDFTLWESGAILSYLVEKYDTEGKLSYKSGNDKFLVDQWLHFQMSGQGPYYGQAAWFGNFHPERIESATTRYRDQVKRVLYVLNNALKGKQYLVGDKCTIADLAFVPWDSVISWLMGDEYKNIDVEKDYPHWNTWHKRLTERPAVKKVLAAKAAASGH